MAKLLNLTMVSKKWKETLMRTRMLWTHINVDSSDQDSEATIAVFLHLSGMAPLTLTISAPLSSYWDNICRLLLPNNTRIHNIILESNKVSHLPGCKCMRASDSEDDEPGRVFKHVIETLDLFKTKNNFEVTSATRFSPETPLSSPCTHYIYILYLHCYIDLRIDMNPIAGLSLRRDCQAWVGAGAV
ncbi:hypothetical protein M408DRAFT_169504 [Serendipita vermifera MAFF 305830]|uniref:F-box domain-containing protein n=1 Tax=Serendipita vermifera MAFF 305830 TaxID=933852 RepID=A0A0C3AS42_SERVB|nr:hypothetical protein M408DRAFT_169504 [Serendipita vermifera MAFF 305830]